jgi:hypothetical protein
VEDGAAAADYDRAMPRRAALAAVLGTAVALSAAAPAGASVFIGSNLISTPNTAGACASVTCTATNLALPPSKQAYQGLQSPVNGTVTSWDYRAAGPGNPISLRVLHPNGGLSFTATGTTPSVPVLGGIRGEFAADLPIEIGDSVGVNSSGAQIFANGVAGASQISWTLPPLAEGEARDGTTSPGVETLIRVIVQPANTVRFASIERNRKKGTARVLVTVPNAGTLTYSGSGVTATGPPSLDAPGDVRLLVKTRGTKRKRLRDKGVAHVIPKVTFRPVLGDVMTTPIKVKLTRKR